MSRKRKKPRKSKASTQVTGRRVSVDPYAPPRHELAKALTDLASYRSQVDTRRALLAASAAETFVVELVDFAPTRSDSDLEDELCSQLGVRLLESANGPIDDCVNPNPLAEATVTAAAEAVRAALTKVTTEPEGWRAPWRVLTAAARIVSFPLSEMAADVIEQLRDLPGGHVLPKTADGPTVTGQVLWTRDVYGSRFGVAAAFSTLDGPDRWYLWDIDACGHQAFTVHSAYYPTPEQALAAWQAGVGGLAAGATTFVPVDHPELLAELMPAEEGFMRAGGENADQFAEYHRSKRLAEAAIKAVGPGRVGQVADLDAATAATEFAAWLRQASQPDPDELEALSEELADSWCLDSPAAVYGTCSPHRVALTVLHLRNYYQDDFAAQLIALLPDWVSWLAARHGIAPHLAGRCRTYALGEPHAEVGSDDSRPNYLARVVE
ncbi:MAG: hypothetical protein ACRDTF_17220 [Pseudonocardiaceae bacterium]